MKKSIALVLSFMLVFSITLMASAVPTITVKSIKLNTGKITLEVGQTSNLKATLTPANATQKSLTYVTDNKKIATVSNIGEVTGVNEGTTTITVYTPNKKIFAKCNITVSPAKKVTIHLWEKPAADASEGQIKMYEAWMARVKAKFPNITIIDEALPPGTDYRQAYDKALMTGQAPTAVRIFPSGDVPTRIANGTIADITDLVKNWDLMKSGKVFKGFGDSLQKNGRTYAIPYDAYVMGILVNKKALAEGGGNINYLPKTWQAFSALGKKITDKTKPRFGFEILGQDWCAWPFSPWVWSSGGEMVKPNGDGTFRITFNENPGVDAAMYWNQMVWKDQMTQKDALQDWNKYQDDIMSGRAVFSFADLAWLNQEDLKKVGLTLNDFTVMPFPSKNASLPPISFSAGQVITFNPKATKEEIKAAFDVYTYIKYDKDVLTEQWKIQDKYGIADLEPPVRTDLVDTKYSLLTAIPASLKKDLSRISKYAKIDPACGNWNDLKNALVSPLQQIILKKDITREECKQILTKCADDLYAKYPNSFRK